MSKSPQKNLRRSLEALNEVLETCARFPDARAELVLGIGEDGLAELERIRLVMTRLMAQSRVAQE